MFQGSYTALITPFKNGEVDIKTFEALVERQIVAGTHGIVPSGTTGESPTLSHEEHNYVIEACVKIASGRVKVLAGTGSNCTKEAISVTLHAQNAGADGALIMTPYYNKPTPEGVYRHFEAIHNATDIPIILYNIPGRSIVDISDETIMRLAELPRIIGIKDATGDIIRQKNLSESGIKKEFVSLCGDDALAVEFNNEGGNGCISVTSNLVPKLCADMQNACINGNMEEATAIQERLMPLHDVMFCETSPAPVKYAAELMNLCSGELRLPLVAPSDENKEKILKVLEKLSL